MKQKISLSQKAAAEEWIKRTVPSRNYSIGEAFADCEADRIHIRAMRRLVTLGLLKPGITGGNPLKEMI